MCMESLKEQNRLHGSTRGAGLCLWFYVRVATVSEYDFEPLPRLLTYAEEWETTLVAFAVFIYCRLHNGDENDNCKVASLERPVDSAAAPQTISAALTEAQAGFTSKERTQIGSWAGRLQVNMQLQQTSQSTSMPVRNCTCQVSSAVHS